MSDLILFIALAGWAGSGIYGHLMFCADYERVVGHLPDGWCAMSLLAAILGPTVLVEEVVRQRRNRQP